MAGEHRPPSSTLAVGQTKAQRVFFWGFLPLGAITNLVLGLVVLTDLKQQGSFGWLELGTGAFCCMVAGWLAATAWSRSYWNRNIARQVTLWRSIADAFFTWLEEAPLPVDSLHTLKESINEVVPSPTRQ